MDISFINSQALLHLLSLTEKKEEILRILEQIDAEILRTLKGGVSVEVVEIASAPTPAAPALKPVAAAKAPAKPAKAEKARRGKSGGLKGRILALLEEAGDQGLRVKKIAEKLNAKPGNISVWFSTTGKDITTKLAPGLYAKKGTGKPAVVKAAKPVKAKKKGGISPEGRAKIAAAAKARWAKVRAGKATPAVAKPAKAKKKRTLSPEVRAKLAANMKARWAAKKAAAPAKKIVK